MIVSGIAALCIFICLFLGRNYEKEFLREQKKKGVLPLFFLTGGLWVYDRIRKYRPENARVLQMERALLKSKAEKRLKNAETAGIALLVVLAGCIGCFLLALKESRAPAVTALRRPSFGEERAETLAVSGLSGTDDVSVHVTGQVPQGSGMDAVFDTEYQELLPVILNGNTGFDHVTSKLDFQKESGRGLRVIYKSSKPELLSNYGNIYPEELTEEGADVSVCITLAFADEFREYELPVHIEKEAARVLTEKERLEQMIRELDAGSVGEEVLELPEEFESQAVVFEKKALSPYAFLVLSAVLAFCLVLLPEEKMKARMKDRDEELRRSYPNLLSKLGTLISAGMSIYGAWMRVVRDYEESIRNGRRKPEYAYEEMKITSYEIRSGTSEDQAYAAFGKRCGLHAYIKFGNMLGQNVRQGISGLNEALREEMSKALEERRNEALRLGEVAGTRLLFPMMLMLGVVIISLIVPAFLSF